VATPTPLSITATAVAGITLVPFSGKGFSGVVPDGWTEKNSGEFWRGAPETDQSPIRVAHVPTEGLANRFFIVSAAGSHDPHGYPVGLIWDFGDASPQQYRPEAIHIYAESGPTRSR
jgi:hypothetical protein